MPPGISCTFPGKGRAGKVRGVVTPDAARSSTARLLTAYHGQGDETARQRVIEQNLPLVYTLARRFSSSPEHVDDLVQVGAIGLIKAVDGFEAARGTDLGAYAVPTIVGELRRIAGDRAWPVRIPRGRGGAARPPVAVELDEDAFEAPSARAELDRSEERAVLRGAFRVLTRRERHVVVLRFYRDWSQQRIGDELGLSQAQVSRLLRVALAKMRDALVNPVSEPLCDSSQQTTISRR
jgi:RNA polymerase sigma-B factor